MVAELLATGQSQSSRQLKELVFRQEVRLVEAAERDREFKVSHPASQRTERGGGPP
jgi:hypothetical protein